MKKFAPLLLVILVSCVPWNTAPDCKIVTPLNGSEYSRGDSIQVYVDASDDGAVAEVRLYLDGLGIFSISTFPYVYTLETSTLEIGAHTLKAEVLDESRKEGNSEVSFTINPGLPQVTTLEPILTGADAMIVGGTIFNDGGADISRAGVYWSDKPYDFQGAREVIIPVLSNTFSTTLTNLEYPTYYVTAFAENETGRSYGAEVSFAVPLPPEVEILNPTEGSLHTQGDTIMIQISATAPGGLIQQVRYYVDSRPIAASDGFPYIVLYPTNNLGIGSHTLRAEVEDDSGNQADDSVNFLINAAK